ncbi:hypothetical protein ZWY2020_039049 [Hordeum vulgare]|nr:hypothetical protein ZWY2020_039049 [Hordeum vulgare]
MKGPRRRPDGEAASTYAKDSGYFNVEVIHGGVFFGSGLNMCYFDGKKMNIRHNFQMIYLDRLDSHISGGGSKWDDVVANRVAEFPTVFSPIKKPSSANESNTSCSVVDETHEIQSHDQEISHDQFFVRLRPRAHKLEEEEEQYADSESADSDYIPEIIDSDCDLEDGDEDLLQEQLHPVQDKKGKKVVEDCNS